MAFGGTTSAISKAYGVAFFGTVGENEVWHLRCCSSRREGNEMRTDKRYEALRHELMIQRSVLVEELERRRFDVPSREGVIARDERPPIAHDAYLAAEFDRIETDMLGQIDQALSRLDEGTYGTCVDCGKLIEARRLEAVPWAERCFTCQVIRTDSDRENEMVARWQRGTSFTISPTVTA